MVELLRQRALHQAEERIYTFLEDGDEQASHLTYAELDRRARAIAGLLQSLTKPGERALLLYPPGLDYIAGFMGCLYAGIIAVPAYPPDPSRLNRSLPRLQAIVEDAQPAVVLTTSSILAMSHLLKWQNRLETLAGKMPVFRRAVEFFVPGRRSVGSAPGLAALNWLTTDNLEAGWENRWWEPKLASDTLAFLQYTSGSTGTPKGVMVSHANLLHNSALICHGFGMTPECEGVIWLPMYHDMGLIGGVLQPLYVGCHVTLMSPLAFLQWPLRWLKAISRVKDRPVISGGPNFAYDLCVRKVSAEQKAQLDLSRWTVAFSGAEPVRAETIEQFTQTFAACGFRRQAFYPCYGLAEATLIVSGGRQAEPPIIRTIDKQALAHNRFREAGADTPEKVELVGCGQALLDEKIVIVNPDTLMPCGPGEIGEIWVAGPSIARGYWNNPKATQETFQACLADSGEGPFMRTGDLGCLHHGELFVAGRLKDLIIIRGRNHYPQDIELTVERCHPALRPGCGAAFSMEAEGEERLVIVQEVRQSKKLDLDAVIHAIRRAVAEAHELQVYAIALIKPRSIPKTSSGKIQRRPTKQAFLSGTLELVTEWRSTGEPLPPVETAAVVASETTPAPVVISAASANAAAIKSWLVAHLAELLHLPAPAIDPRQNFASFGLDSAQTVSLTGDLAAWLGRPVSPTLAWEYPTIEQLANHLAGEAPKPIAAPPVTTSKSTSEEPIAIVGLGCRFPGAGNLGEFWELLRNGVDAIREVPPDRWNSEAYYDPTPGVPGKMVTRWGGFIDHVDQFDHQFFGISPREAAQMDPQQRLLLEVTWEALEDAGLTAEKIAGSQTGVFIGISTNDYSRLSAGDTLHINAYSGTGNALSIAANRLSYLLDAHGPSLAVDTACSSSLVAVHYACESLRHGECEAAIAGGVNLILVPEIAINFSQAGVMAPDGRCKTFDARANGYVRGEGAGVVILKPLSKALADGDHIYALIRGSAVNSDGRSNGLMAPNRLAQEAVIRAAYARSGIAPGRVQYVEAHGTGTNLGDPIEVQALAAVLAIERPAGRKCAIGSVKTNIGHLEAAAGVAGLIKVVLALEHRWLPPSLHFKEPNPLIPFAQLPVFVQDKPGPWPQENEPLIAGVSSFGFGGTNSHLVVEEYPQSAAITPVETEGRRPYLLPLSAHSPEALKDLARAYQAFLAGKGAALPLRDICYTASVRRTHRDYRLALVTHSKEELTELLEAFLREESRPAIATGRKPAGGAGRLVFVFPGQGAQWWAMGRELLEQEPVFRAKITECDQLLRKHADWSLLAELQAEEASSRINEIDIIQPALFAVQVALAALWRSWGVHPEAVVGHSMGEVAAAHVAGVLSLEEAVAVIYHRSRLLKRNAGKGAMAAVELSLEEARQVLQGYEDRLAVAVHAGPKSTVLSGDPQALAKVLATLGRRGIFCRVLRVDVAAHNPQVEPLRQELVETLRDLQPRESAVPIYSTVTGQLLAGTQFDADYWGRNLRQPVLFAAAIEQLVQNDHTLFVEINPHPILSGAIRSVLNLFGKEGVALPSLRREEEERGVMYASLGSLFAAGHPVAWPAFYSVPGKHVSLPAIPWQHERHWLEIEWEQSDRPRRAGERVAGNGRHPLIGSHRNSPLLPGKHLWERELQVAEVPFLADHRVRGSIVVPATAHLEMALEAASEAFGDESLVLQNVSFHEALILPENEARAVQVIVSPTKPGLAVFQIFSQPYRGAHSLQEGGEQQQLPWTLHSMGTIGNGQKKEAEKIPAEIAIKEILARCSERVSGETHFLRLRRRGLQLGPTFQGVEEIWRREGEALGKIFLAPGLEKEAASCHLHPALFDACFQIVSAAVPVAGNGADDHATYLPVSVGELRFYRRPGPRLFSHAVLHPVDHPDSLTCDIRLLDEDGRVLAEIFQLGIQRVGGAEKEKLADWLYELQWQPAEVTPPKPAPRSAETWLILADTTGVAQALAGLLESHGARCVVVTAGANWQAADRHHFTLDPNRPEDFRRLLQEAVHPTSSPCRGIVHLWSLDVAATDIAAVASLITGSVRHLLQALADAGWPSSPRLWLVTRGAQCVGTENTPVAVMPAPLWGLGRALAREHPELQSALIDLDPSASAHDGQNVFDELWPPTREEQVAFRQNRRYVARLIRSTNEALQKEALAAERAGQLNLPATPSFELVRSTAGTLDGLQLQPRPRRQPERGEVEIQVHAAGLNFANVMNALGVNIQGTIPFGAECAGKIVAVGEGVHDLGVGDEVLAVAPACFSKYVTTPATLVLPKPAKFSYEEAATIPIAFLTAYYALHHLARLRKGERVLIHAAAGGVGLAAVQIAQMIGAEIFATAGSPEKRAFLESLGLEHIMSSRSLDFADEILHLTNGQGVDVVLNSLPGEAIARSLLTLAPYGRFLEIGKVDIYQNRQLDLYPFRKNLSYFAIDIDRLCRERSGLMRRLLDEVMELMKQGRLRPLPLRVFPIVEAVDAFRFMAQRKNIGKIVLSMPEHAGQETTVARERASALFDGTYLITGGLGALGLLAAQWLVNKGARHLVLVGRKGASEEAQRHLDLLRQAGAEVVLSQADVAEEDQIAGVIDEITRKMPPLKGIVHAAGVLDDGVLLQLNAERFNRVMRPKVLGAWHLHCLTRHIPLDFFIMFSSLASVFGSPGQSNYAAANAFMDALAHHRRGLGLPALSINWGPWSQVGLAARPDRGGRLEVKGVNSITPEIGMQLFDLLLRPKTTSGDASPAQVMVAAIDWKQLLALYAADNVPPMFAGFLAERIEVGDDRRGRKGRLTREQLLAAEPAQRREMLAAYLQGQIARVRGVPVTKISRQQPLNAMGLDSLMAIELKNTLDADLKMPLPIATLLQGPSISELAAQLLAQLAAPAPAAAPAPVMQAAVTPVTESRLSPSQRALWFQHQLAPESVPNLVFFGRLEHEVDDAKLAAAFQKLVDRHAALRTTFFLREGEPWQRIHPQAEACFHTEQAAAWSEEQLRQRLDEEMHHRFHLERGPLLRAHLFRRGPGRDLLLLVSHHIINDLWSQTIIMKELGELYADPNAVLPPLPLQYTDFVRWQEQMLAGAEGERLWQYWRHKLAGELPVLDLPTDRPRPPVLTYRGGTRFFTLDEALTAQLKALGDRHGATLYMTLLAAFNVLLYRYSGQEDLIVASPTTGRSTPELAGIVGYFVNPVVLRSNLAGRPAFTHLLAQVRDNVLEMFDHQDFPFAHLVEKLQPARDPGRSPVFQVMFVYQKAHLLEAQSKAAFAGGSGGLITLGGLTFEPLTADLKVTPFDLTLMMAEATNGLSASLYYNRDLFEAETIDRFIQHFETLLRSLVAEPAQSIARLALLPPEEERKLLVEWNDTRRDGEAREGGDWFAHRLFEKQAAAAPDATAVVLGEQRLTYGELNRRANQLAHLLEQHGVRPESRVAICLERSPEMVTAVLAVLKAGGAYVPMDAGHPEERLNFMLADSGATVLLTDSRLAQKFAGVSAQRNGRCCEMLCLDDLAAELMTLPATNPVTALSPENLAYLIYTSGSTGRPKGVMLTQRSVANMIRATSRRYYLDAGCRVLQFASFSFDACVQEMLATLAVGAALHLTAAETLLSPLTILQQLRDEQITNLTLPPSLLAILPAEDLPALRTVISAGEACNREVAARWSAGRHFINAYGPTEATVCTACHEVETVPESGNVPIGRPIDNFEIYLLDRQLNPVPVGVPGELHIGGMGLARGYHRRPDLTAEKFLPHPFSSEPGRRLYKTGDLARYLPDGRLEFLGRVDYQVKIRGFRIELEEIETVLRNHPAVEQAVIKARPERQQLVAYYTARQNGTAETAAPLTPAELKSYLQEYFPDYMVPAAFIRLDAMPLTPSGKIDRRALPEIERTAGTGGPALPRNEAERTLAELWQNVLHVPAVGVNDNFFEMGGHSLNLIQLQLKIKEVFGREVSVVDLFRFPTITALAGHLSQAREEQPTLQKTGERAARQREALERQRQQAQRRPVPAGRKV
ncbi:MAG: amino acid adenylation domain-containing protein [candidate division KSB1 bacterium]|nr:amino acid adenylation domain-containing protein [candidate division KSB1 bacterium]MDZ7299881.1 amino acid adenylation domain-containing protein [candidate division KSB1 bacterium]MDZ7350792.1 amino acid adenylation domain-containing protein [candidate division KSB1 bacterium]MDZ7383753.1 amino acid adenylation domain-containing protein [candidate division KSB1 bacterium]MDZ7397353.1 amino acid adenylation domain-containing protein [candidate division KSB1 bacterium]